MHWIYAHLIGDFILQNDWMQRKGESSLHCSVHVATYLVPFAFTGLTWWQVALIGVQHWLQDRFNGAALWQRLWRQTPADKWPQGRLWVDQIIHVLWMAAVASL